MSETAPKAFVMPVELTTRVDVSRVERELQALHDFMAQAVIRKPGVNVSLPRLSRPLEQLAAENDLNLLIKEEQLRLLATINQLKQKAPVLHISFGAEPSAAFLQQVVTWFRRDIHPYALLRVGLQPGIGAGCIVRTPNKIFDLSMRERLNAQGGALLGKIAGTRQ